MKQIAHELTLEQTTAFLHILADTYKEYDFRPALCRLACIEFEKLKYIAAADGYIALFLPAPDTLECGDYEGAPYMVKSNDDGAPLCRLLKGLLNQLVECSTAETYIADNVEDFRCFIADETKTDVLLAHVADGKFVIDSEKQHAFIFDRKRYEFLANAVGYFKTVRYSKPNKMLMFDGGHRGFALLMPVQPDAPIAKVRGG